MAAEGNSDAIAAKPDIDSKSYLILDTEGIIFGMGEASDGKITYPLFQEVAIARLFFLHGQPYYALLYYAQLEYSIPRFIKEQSEEIQDKLRLTARIALAHSGCLPSFNGVPFEVAHRHVLDIIEHYKEAEIVAKGPFMEKVFLMGLGNKYVITKHWSLPDITDLTVMGCPRFENLPVEYQIEGHQAVHKMHFRKFHPNAKHSHCCAAEVLAFSHWLARRMRKPLTIKRWLKTNTAAK